MNANEAAIPRGAILALAVTVVLWASAFPVLRAALREFPPAELAALRFTISSLALGGYAIFAGLRPPALRDIPKLLGLGAVGFTAYNLVLNAGARHLQAGAVSFIVNTVPVFTALLARFTLHERIGRRTWIGIAVSLTGVGIIALSRSSEGPARLVGFGAALVLLAALCQSAFFTGQKALLGAYRPVELTTFAIWAGTLLLLPFLPAAIRTARTASAPAVWAVAWLAVVVGVVGFVAYAHALKHIPVSRATAVLFAIPPLSMAIAWLMLREVPPLTSVVGGALALVGVALVIRSRAA